MRYTIVAPAILAVTAIAAPVPQDDLIDTVGAAVNVGGDKTVGVSKRDTEDVIKNLGLGVNVGGDETTGIQFKRDTNDGGSQA